MADAATTAPRQVDGFFNPLDPEVIRDPYPSYRRLREHRPVYWHEQLQSWVLTRFAECQFVLRNSGLFASDWRRIGLPTPPPLLSLQTLDPPQQTPLRHLGLNALRAQDMASLEQDAQDRVQQMFRELAQRASFDFITDFADRFTLGTIATLLGIEPPEWDERWVRLNNELDHSMDSGLDPDAEQPGLAARSWFSDLVAGWLDSRPKRAVLGYIMANSEQAGVSREVLVNSVRAFFHAGFEVPSRFLGCAMLTLLQHPEALEQLRRMQRIEPAVEELVRHVGPVHAVSRACTSDVELGGQQIKRGQIVIVLIAAANRDPEQFEYPEELILDRDPNPHMGFGRGSHSCLGSHVARMQGRVVISGLLRQKAPRLAGEPVYRPNATLRGLSRLPMTLGA
jgi:cytochrome P450